MLIAGGLLLIDPGLVTDIIGAGIAVAVAVIQIASRRTQQASSTPA
jgi:UPF0716 family protein affecting phage T7 exclusion